MRTVRRRTWRREQGSLLLLSTFMISLLSAVLTAALTRSTTEMLAARQLVSMAQEYQWAESGLDCAISALRTDPDPSTSNLTATDLATMGTACSCNDPDTDDPLTNPPACPLGQGAGVTVVKTVSLSLLPGVQPLQGPRYQIDGQWTHNGHGVLQRMVVQRIVRSPFQQAAYGTTDWSFGVEAVYGGLVDSYNSSLGSYGAALSPANPTYGSWNKSQYDAGAGTCIGCNAEVQTNSTSATNGWGAAVTIAYVDSGRPSTILGPASMPSGGLAYVGPLNVLSGPTNQKSAMTFAAPQEPNDPETECQRELGAYTETGVTSYPESIVCASSLTVNGAGKQTLFPNLQKLYVRGAIAVTNGATLSVSQGEVRGVGLTVSGVGSTMEGTNATSNNKVDLYVDWFDVNGTGSTLKGASNAPKRLRIYANTSSGSVIQNNATVYGLIYSPNGSVAIIGGSSALYGAVIGRWCSVDIGQLHFDEAVKDSLIFLWPTWMRADVNTLAQGTNLAVVTSVCGDGICNGPEKPFSCPADCGGGGEVNLN